MYKFFKKGLKMRISIPAENLKKFYDFMKKISSAVMRDGQQEPSFTFVRDYLLNAKVYFTFDISVENITEKTNFKYLGFVEDGPKGFYHYSVYPTEFDLTEYPKKCDHCQIIRRRNIHHFFLTPSGDVYTVGSTCVNEVFGMDVATSLNNLEKVMRVSSKSNYTCPVMPKRIIAVLYYLYRVGKLETITPMQAIELVKNVLYKGFNHEEYFEFINKVSDDEINKNFQEFVTYITENRDKTDFFGNVYRNLTLSEVDMKKNYWFLIVRAYLSYMKENTLSPLVYDHYIMSILVYNQIKPSEKWDKSLYNTIYGTVTAGKKSFELTDEIRNINDTIEKTSVDKEGFINEVRNFLDVFKPRNDFENSIFEALMALIEESPKIHSLLPYSLFYFLTKKVVLLKEDYVNSKKFIGEVGTKITFRFKTTHYKVYKNENRYRKDVKVYCYGVTEEGDLVTVKSSSMVILGDLPEGFFRTVTAKVYSNTYNKDNEPVTTVFYAKVLDK